MQSSTPSLPRDSSAATAAPMTLFYRGLWEEKLPPAEAVRKAQLAIYRHPEALPIWARGERGPDLKKSVPATAPPTKGEPAPRLARTPTRLWAAFVLSGAGRPGATVDPGQARVGSTSKETP
jgi:CHAT domain-containing protein